MSNNDEIDVRLLDLEEAYKVLTTEAVDGKVEKSILEKVRFGIDMDFDLYASINGMVVIKPKSKIAKIMGYGTYELSKYWTELEKREALIKRTLYEIMEEPKIAKARGEE